MASGFPRAPGVLYTGRRLAGYDVQRSEVDPADAEVVFLGHGTSGQVTLTQECRARTLIRITVRPG